MTLPRTVSDVLAEHTVFEIECIDRMYLNVYVPQLQYPAGIVGYVNRQRGLPITSTAPLGKITDAFSAAMRRFAVNQGVPWVDFVKGHRKDEVMHQHLAGFTGTEGVLFIGRAQEKTTLFRTEKRRNAEGRSYPWIVKTTGMVNHFYVYAVDADFGPFFLKFCSYFPYNASLCFNGHEWAKRQAANAGIGPSLLVPEGGREQVVDYSRTRPAVLVGVVRRVEPDQRSGVGRGQGGEVAERVDDLVGGGQQGAGRRVRERVEEAATGAGVLLEVRDQEHHRPAGEREVEAQ